MSLRALVAAFVAAATLLASPGVARAWVETHVEGDEITVSIERGGKARVEHSVTLRIAGGPQRTLEIRGVDPDAAVEEGAYVIPKKEAERGSIASATAVKIENVPADGRSRSNGPPLARLRVRLGDRGLSRGVFVLRFRYRTDLSSRITRDGAMARLVWPAPVWDDGFDSARVTFELPSAPSEPRADTMKGDGGEAEEEVQAPLVLSNLKRSATSDSLELVRPYSPKGEAILWAILADPHALLLAPPPPPEKPKTPMAKLSAALETKETRTLWFGVAGAAFVVFAFLVGAKSREVERLSLAARTVPRPLVPLPMPVRAFGAGMFLVGGLALQFALGHATLGAAAVLAAALFATHRTPAFPKEAKLRPRGRWYPLSAAAAFKAPPRPHALLDASTRAGKVLFLLTLGGLGFGVAVVAEDSLFQAILLAFDVTVLLALFGTGRASELPPDPAVHPAPFLGDVARRVQRSKLAEGARVVGKIRVPDGATDPDELRLAVVPKTPLQGFISIEVGVVYAQGAGGAVGFPSLLLRYGADSPCAERAQKLARGGRSMRGRRPNEHVVAFSPRFPTARMTAAIASALVRAVTNDEARAKTAQAGKPKGEGARNRAA